MFTRRQVLGTAALIPFIRIKGDLPVVENGIARAAVTGDAAELVTYVERATGVRLPSVQGPGDTLIIVGANGPDPAVPGLLAELDRDGFLIRPFKDTITIVGPTPTGTANGVRAFLERYVDVRWLLPGPDGEDVPRRTTISVSPLPVREEPSFTMRSLSPLRDGKYPIQQQWAQRNRLQGVGTEPIAFHHNLHTLFPVERYGTTHPEYYPNGRPPAPGKLTGWQPAFTVPGTIDAAVTGILEYFDANPGAPSFSLGVNDGEGFAELDPVPAYYAWVNEVVRRVLLERPGKTFGLLAYRKLETPPAFPLHPAVVPFLTKDRYTWTDPAAEADGHALTERWLAVCSQLGFYDYLYGAPYLLPRVFPHEYARTIRYAKEKGVVAQYAELYPNWGEGPKPWVTARLLWDAQADVDALQREWLVRAVGATSAGYLAAYYQLWERFWAERVPASDWFLPDATYQSFNLPQYLELVEEADLTRSRTLLDSAVARADTPARTARAKILRRVFELYESSALSYPRQVATPADQATALAVLRHGVDSFQSRLDLAARRLALIKEFAADPVLVLQMNPASFPNLTWTGWNPSEFWSLVEYLRVHEPSGGPVTDATAGHPYGDLIGAGVARPDQATDAWRLLPRSTGTRAFTQTGGLLRITGQGWGGPSQIVDVDPGLAQVTARYRAPAGTAASVQVALDLIDTTNTPIPSSSVRSPVIFLRPTGEWITLRFDAEIPATARNKPVDKVELILLVDSAADIQVEFDDVVLRTIAKGQP
ncbi:DUF4838 domain-containing protein [Nonomuraea sp. NPDC050556]|uniref:DUF4838 domain-containing protein n=1 Tax=Nonomuraea sp. NPDC050556 TaxID=3364369 RepID=UPI0037B6F4D2